MLLFEAYVCERDWMWMEIVSESAEVLEVMNRIVGRIWSHGRTGE